MGSTASKFRKNLVQGEEFAVMQMYEKHPELRKSIDPNDSLGETQQNNTYLHIVCRHAMKSLLRIFLFELSGNPNKKNSNGQTGLHILFQGGPTRQNSALDAKLRAECLSLLLAWEGLPLPSGEVEKVNLNAVDVKNCTALHYASICGYKRCVEMLISKGADMFLENEAKETACDCAERCGHFDTAEFLETKMVFSNDPTDTMNEDDYIFPVIETYSGLRETDLREAKDQLLVETSDMLHVPLFTAEALLRNHEWSRESLLEAWMRDPVLCCEKCGVQPPAAVVRRSAKFSTSSIKSDSEAIAGRLGGAKSASDPRSPRKSFPSDPGSSHLSNTHSSRLCRTAKAQQSSSFQETFEQEDEDVFSSDPPLKSEINELVDNNAHMECGICTYPIEFKNRVATVCEHNFCRSCWRSYLNVKIGAGDLNTISCPEYECSKLVPVEVIEQVLSPVMARKYLKFDIKAFVDSNPRIKWCPEPGCSDAVRLPDSEEPPNVALRAFPRLQPPPPTSKTVFCPRGHPFCWECLQDGHEPTSCEKWKEWHNKISEVKPEELKGTSNASETAANCLWLVTHSKPCSKCKSPIQKNEGCNHMKCSKCKHEFCWVCLGPWKKHGTETGGFFRCNRFDDSRKADERTEQAVAAATEQNKKTQELNKFVHYYSRYKNHLNSYEMETPLLDRVELKMDQLIKAASKVGASNSSDMKFLKDAVKELLRSRKVLSSSYAYGYFLTDLGYNKTIFEYLQNELEVTVESLSALVARPYLRSSRSRIVHTTYLVRQKRHSFTLCISRGLMPPETPPGLRKLRKRHLPAILGIDMEEDDWLKSGTTGKTEVDPNRPWVKDNRGRHRNLLALLDWPDEYDSEEEEMSQMSIASTSAVMGNSIGGTSSGGLCSRKNCTRMKVKNPRTGTYHPYCSLRCRYLDTRDEDELLTTNAMTRNNQAYNVDLMIALQMSRLQLLQDLKLLGDVVRNDVTEHHHSEDVSSPSTTSVSSSQADRSRQSGSRRRFSLGDEMDPDLQLAIERSMMESSSESPAVGSFGDDHSSPPGRLPSSSEDGADGALVNNIDIEFDDTIVESDENSDVKVQLPETVPNDPELLHMFLRRFAAKETSFEKGNLLETSAQEETVRNLTGQDKKVAKLLLADLKSSMPSTSAAHSSTVAPTTTVEDQTTVVAEGSSNSTAQSTGH